MPQLSTRNIFYSIRFSITIEGPIVSGDNDRFKKEVIDQLHAGHLITSVNIFSPGGDVDQAIEIGKQIRTLGAQTSAPFLDGDERVCMRGELDAQLPTTGGTCDCQSACFIIWSAGTGRNGTFVGVHRPRFEADYFKNLTPQRASEKYSEVEKLTRDYFREKGIPDWAVSRMYSVASTKMEFLN